MKRQQAIKTLTNYLSSVNFDGVNHCGGKDLNELIAKVSIDFLYEMKIMRPVEVEHKSNGCMHTLRESCNCGYGETIVRTDWTK